MYQYFVNSYIDGITPNPCVVCNKNIKFGKMFELMKYYNCDYLATGHYVINDNQFIYKAKDHSKDQSYFLAQIDRGVIPYLIFPLGNSYKVDIKRAAQTLGPLKSIANSKESSEICFVENSYVDILKQHTNVNKEGNVIDTDGTIIGKHKGYMHYTIGKRRGFDVPLAHLPHYVIATYPKTNEIVASTKNALKINYILANKINMFIDVKEFKCEVKVRYRSIGISANITLNKDIATIKLDEYAYGVAKGQYVVFYQGDKLIGSAQIIDTDILTSPNIYQSS